MFILKSLVWRASQPRVRNFWLDLPRAYRPRVYSLGTLIYYIKPNQPAGMGRMRQDVETRVRYRVPLVREVWEHEMCICEAGEYQRNQMRKRDGPSATTLGLAASAVVVVMSVALMSIRGNPNQLAPDQAQNASYADAVPPHLHTNAQQKPADGGRPPRSTDEAEDGASPAARAFLAFWTLPWIVLPMLANEFVIPELQLGAKTWWEGATLRAKLSAGLAIGGGFAAIAAFLFAAAREELCAEKHEEKQIRFAGRELVCHEWVRSAVATLSFGLSAFLGLILGALLAVFKKPLYMLIALALALVGWRRWQEAAPAGIRYGPIGGVRPCGHG
jgi:hypothetical protein